MCFFQLVLPIGDPKRSGVKIDDIKYDGCMGFYHKMEEWSLLHAARKGFASSYGHGFKPVNNVEFAHSDAVVIRDGALGGSKGNIHIRWKPGKFESFHAMTHCCVVHSLH